MKQNRWFHTKDREMNFYSTFQSFNETKSNLDSPSIFLRMCAYKPLEKWKVIDDFYLEKVHSL